MSIKEKFSRKIKSPYGLHKDYMLHLRPGYTALVGPNGAGKTTLLHQIRDFAKAEGFEVFTYENIHDGGKTAMGNYVHSNNIKAAATALCSSEGEQITINFGQHMNALGQLVRKCVEQDKPLFILLDGLDSGASIDRARELMNLFHMIEQDVGIQPGGAKHAIYIINAVNNYELARNISVDPRTGETHCFMSYKEYAKFICEYFDTHKNPDESEKQAQ